jgi:hypothetical protein
MADQEVKFGEELQVGEALDFGWEGTAAPRRGIEAPADGTEVELRNDVVVPLLGLAVDPYKLGEVAEALDAVRQAKRLLDEARGELERLLAEEAQRRGTKTMHIGNKTVEISGGPETVYDIEVLGRLQEVGLPEDRYNELVKTRIEYRVDRNVVRQLLGSGNQEYSRIINWAASVQERPYRVSVKLS